MRDNLLGYLLEALEPHERDAVEQDLERDPRLRVELELLDRGLEPLRADRGHLEPPHGLAQRTCDFVITQATAMLVPTAGPSRFRWTMADFVVAAGIMIAASMMFFPALNHSRSLAQLAGCQNNMRQVGLALTGYSQHHNGYLPELVRRGRFAIPWSVGSKLVEDGYLTISNALRCPASGKPASGSEVVPTVAQIRSAEGGEWAAMERRMEGGFAFNVGYVENGHYRTAKNSGRSRSAILADPPNFDCPTLMSQSHGGGLQNVMFGDMHVKPLCSCRVEGGRDDIFRNNHNEIAPGIDSEDSVVAWKPIEILVEP